MSYTISQSARFQPLRCLPLHFLLQFCAIVVLCPALSTRCAAIFPRRLDDSSRARSHLPFFRAVGSGCTAMRLDSKPRLLAAAEFRGTLHCFRRIMHCSSYSTCALSALTYAIMAPYIAFTTYLCLIYGVKFSPTQAALWITSTGWATLIELFIQEPLLILSSTVVKNFSLRPNGRAYRRRHHRASGDVVVRKATTVRDLSEGQRTAERRALIGISKEGAATHLRASRVDSRVVAGGRYCPSALCRETFAYKDRLASPEAAMETVHTIP